MSSFVILPGEDPPELNSVSLACLVERYRHHRREIDRIEAEVHRRWEGCLILSPEAADPDAPF